MSPVRVCGYCGDRDPFWFGRPSTGWGVRENKPVCRVCMFVEPWNQPKEGDAT